MTRDERLEELWRAVSMLDEKQFNEVIVLFEDFVLRGQRATWQGETAEPPQAKSYVDFIIELSATLRTSEDAAEGL